MKALMYHYVRPASARDKNLNFLHMDDFRRQLDHLQNIGDVLNKEQFDAVFLDGEKPESNSFLLTFDDGFIDHYQYVFPELVQRGLTGVFFVPSAIITDEKPLAVHRLHFLLAHRSASEIYAKFETLFTPAMLHQEDLEKFQDAVYPMHDDILIMRKLKVLFNYALKYDARRYLMDQLCEHFDESITKTELYLNRDMIQEMHNKQMVMAAHSHNHFVMSRLDPSQQLSEINQSFGLIEECCGSVPRFFCYPYGRKPTYNQVSIDLLKQENCKFSFAVEPQDITADILHSQPYELPRYDCNQFPFGQVRKD